CGVDLSWQLMIPESNPQIWVNPIWVVAIQVLTSFSLGVIATFLTGFIPVLVNYSILSIHADHQNGTHQWSKAYFNTCTIYFTAVLCATALQRVHDIESREIAMVLMEFHKRNILQNVDFQSMTSYEIMTYIDRFVLKFEKISVSPHGEHNIQREKNIELTVRSFISKLKFKQFKPHWEKIFAGWNQRAVLNSARIFYTLGLLNVIGHTILDPFSYCSTIASTPSETFCPPGSTGTPILIAPLSVCYCILAAYVQAYQLTNSITMEGLSAIIRAYQFQELLSSAGLRLPARNVLLIDVTNVGCFIIAVVIFKLPLADIFTSFVELVWVASYVFIYSLLIEESNRKHFAVMQLWRLVSRRDVGSESDELVTNLGNVDIADGRVHPSPDADIPSNEQANMKSRENIVSIPTSLEQQNRMDEEYSISNVGNTGGRVHPDDPDPDVHFNVQVDTEAGASTNITPMSSTSLEHQSQIHEQYSTPPAGVKSKHLVQTALRVVDPDNMKEREIAFDRYRLSFRYPMYPLSLRFKDTNVERNFILAENKRLEKPRRQTSLSGFSVNAVLVVVDLLSWPDSIKLRVHVDYDHPNARAVPTYLILSIYYGVQGPFDGQWPLFYLTAFSMYGVACLSAAALERVREWNSREIQSVLNDFRRRELFTDVEFSPMTSREVLNFIDKRIRVGVLGYKHTVQDPTSSKSLKRISATVKRFFHFQAHWEKSFISYNQTAMVETCRLFYGLSLMSSLRNAHFLIPSAVISIITTNLAYMISSHRVHPDSELNALAVINVHKSALTVNDPKDAYLPQYSESPAASEAQPRRDLTPVLTLDFKALETQLAELMKQYPRNYLTNQFNDPDMEKKYLRYANNGMIATRRIIGGLFIIFAVAVIGVFSLGWPDVVKFQETLASMVTLIITVAFELYMTLAKHKWLLDYSHIASRVYMLVFELSNIAVNDSLYQIVVPSYSPHTWVNPRVTLYRLGAFWAFGITIITVLINFVITNTYYYFKVLPVITLSPLAIYMTACLSTTGIERMVEDCSRQIYTILSDLWNRNMFLELEYLSWNSRGLMRMVEQVSERQSPYELAVREHEESPTKCSINMTTKFAPKWEEPYQAQNLRAMLKNSRLLYSLELCGAIFHTIYDQVNLCQGSSKPSETYCPTDSTGPTVFKTRLIALIPLTLAAYIDRYQMTNNITDEGLSTIFRMYHLQELLSTAGFRFSPNQAIFVGVVNIIFFVAVSWIFELPFERTATPSITDDKTSKLKVNV
ncbi:hypothetical protein HDU76_002885, partial [Blyttiomyces sp. JEL0837]